MRNLVSSTIRVYKKAAAACLNSDLVLWMYDKVLFNGLGQRDNVLYPPLLKTRSQAHYLKSRYYHFYIYTPQVLNSVLI